MKKMRRISVVLIGVIIAVALLFTACGGDPTPDDPVPPAKTLTRIAITEKPAKLTYLIGETFDKAGMVVTAYYDDGSSEAVTDYKIDKQGPLSGGDATVTITYGNKVAMLSIIVTIDVEEILQIASDESKVYTVEAEDLDYSKCVNSNDPTDNPNVEISGDASNMRSIGSLAVAGNTFGFAIKSEVAADLTIVMRASAVTRDIDIDTNLDFMWNNTYEYSEHILTWKDNFWGWEHAYFNDLKLKEGTNTLTLRITTGLAPNIDCFYIIVNPTGEEVLGPDADTDPDNPPEYESFLTVETDTLQSYTVEAEALDYSGCISSNNPDGTPNFEHPSTVTSGDTCVSSLGVKGNRFGMTVDSTVAAELSLTMVLSNGNPNDQVVDDLMRVAWNNKVLKTDYTLVWEKDRWHHWESVTVEGLKLKEGANVLDILIIASGAPNIDCFIFNVSPSSEDPEPPVEPPFATFLNVTDTESKVYTVEAEALDYSNCVNSNNPEIIPNTEAPLTVTSGKLCVSSLGIAGNEFGMTVNSTVSADLSIVMRVSSGAPADQVLDELLEITWNGTKLSTNATIVYEDGVWHNWKHVYLDDLTLNAADNVLDIKVVRGGSPNFDCFYFIVNPTGEEILGPAPDTETPEYGTFLNITADTSEYTVEAEALDYSACINSNNHEIPPNIERPSTVTSGDESIGGLSVGGNRFGMTGNSAVEGTVTLKLVVSSGTGTVQVIDDILEIKWNGTKLNTNHTIAWNDTWHEWETVTITGLTLEKGDNVLDIKVISTSPNFDCFKFEVDPAA